MHRPTLILRRFGPLTFGLGYYDDGIWVDHQPSGDSARSGSSMDAVHDWLSCCQSQDQEQATAGQLLRMPGEPDRTVGSAAAR